MASREETAAQARRLTPCIAASVVGLLLATTAVASADTRDTLEKARLSYYSLQRDGLTDFGCAVQPNWEQIVVTARRALSAADEQALRVLKELRISVAAAPARRAKVVRNELPTANEEQAKALQQIFSGMEQTLVGFFDTWSPFVMTSPLPPPTATVTLLEQQGQWSFSYKEGTTDISAVLGEDYAIQAMRIGTPQMASLIQPVFTKSPRGFLLSALQGQYRQLPSGPVALLQMRIDYQAVAGFQLPKTIKVGGDDGAAGFQMEFGLAACQVGRR
jgi:hypothetical protein